MAAQLTRVVQALAPTLRGWGYRRFGQTFNRERESGLIHVIGFQGSRSGDRFTVNVGIYVHEIDQLWHDYWTRDGPGLGTTKVLREELCWLRGRIGNLMAVADDSWWPYADLNGAIQDVGAHLVASRICWKSDGTAARSTTSYADSDSGVWTRRSARICAS